MDIKTTPPERYAEWLLSQGVRPEALHERIAHDMLRALSKQMNEVGFPDEFSDLKKEMDELLAEDAVNRSRL